MSLHKLWEMVEDREAWRAAVCEVTTEQLNDNPRSWSWPSGPWLGDLRRAPPSLGRSPQGDDGTVRLRAPSPAQSSTERVRPHRHRAPGGRPAPACRLLSTRRPRATRELGEDATLFLGHGCHTNPSCLILQTRCYLALPGEQPLRADFCGPLTAATAAPTRVPQATAVPAITPIPQNTDLLPVVYYPGNASARVRDRFSSLQRQNKDIIGWVRIDELLDEPVVQRDNTFYLTRDYRGYHNVNGAIFLDENCGLKTRPYTLTIYGHNMKTGAMFGGLRNYENINYYKNITMEQLCKITGYSSAHLRRLFTKNFGMSPQSYILDKRIEIAKEMLLDVPEKTVDEIADLLGMSSTSYFCKLFRAKNGISPTQYRKHNNFGT